MSTSIHIADLPTTTEGVVIEIAANFYDSSRSNRRYVIHIDKVELEGHARINIIDFAHPTSVTAESGVKRFSRKTLQGYADNWHKVEGVKELLETVLKVRELELTQEAKARSLDLF